MKIVFKLVNGDIEAFDEVAKLSISSCNIHFTDKEVERDVCFLIEFTKHSCKYIPISQVQFFEIEDRTVNHYWE